MSARTNTHPKKPPFIQCQNSDVPEFKKRKCDPKDLDTIVGYMISNGRNYRFNDDIKRLLSQTIFNLKHVGRVRFKVGQNNTHEKRLKDRLVKCGLILWESGHSSHGISSKYSTIEPTRLFFAVLDRLVQLKVGRKRTHIGYWDDLETLNELMLFNEFMEKHDFQLHDGTIDSKHRFNYLTDPSSGKIGRNRLINNGQNIKKDLRKEITVGGIQTKSFDVTATHPQLLHHKYLRQAMPFDPYDIADGNKTLRDAAKIALMIMLNTKTRRGAIQAFRQELEKDKHRAIRAAVILNGKESKIIDAVADRNTGLQQFFYNRMYIQLQQIETNIMWACQQKLMDEGIPSLSVHDDLRIQEQHLNTAIQIYNDCWAAETGLAIEPTHKIK